MIQLFKREKFITKISHPLENCLNVIRSNSLIKIIFTIEIIIQLMIKFFLFHARDKDKNLIEKFVYINC